MGYPLVHQNELCDICDAFRDFAFVAGDKDSCVLKCHVFRCNAPAKAIAMALHEMCSKVIHSIPPPSLLAVSMLMHSLFPMSLSGFVLLF